MKSINIFKRGKTLPCVLLVICMFNLVFTLKIKKQTDFNIEIMNSKTAMTNKTPEKIKENKKSDSSLEKVTYVKEISQGGKEALRRVEQGDEEYQKLLDAGFESPTISTKILTDHVTQISAPADYNYLWKPSDDRDNKLWTNVEFNRYNNRLLDTHSYYTPAHFTVNEDGNTIVHAPSDHGLQIISPATSTLGTFSS